MLLKKLGKKDLSTKDLNTISLLSDDMMNLKGIALSELGRDNDAFAWLQNLTSANNPGGDNFISAALFMVNRGDHFKALEYLQKAIENGYGSLYKLQLDKLSTVNFEPLRSEPEFKNLIDKSVRNFVEGD